VTQDSSPMTPVSVGAPVYTADGDHLGKVDDVQGGFFKVNARLAEDYWLKRAYVATSTADRVTLRFTKDELDKYRGETFDIGNFPETPVGAAVFTRDGKELGKVKEVRAGFFKVDVPRHFDHWFQREFIASSSADKVILEFDEDDVKDYSIKFPNDELPVGVIPSTTEAGSYAESEAAATIRAVEGHPQGDQIIDGRPTTGP
jgi:hypothetical protein